MLELTKRTPTPYATAKPIVSQAVQEVGATGDPGRHHRGRAPRHGAASTRATATWVPADAHRSSRRSCPSTSDVLNAPANEADRLRPRRAPSAAERGRPPPRRRGGPRARRRRPHRATARRSSLRDLGPHLAAHGPPSGGRGARRGADLRRPLRLGRHVRRGLRGHRRTAGGGGRGGGARAGRLRRARARRSWPSAPSSCSRAERTGRGDDRAGALLPRPGLGARSASTRWPRGSGSSTRRSSPPPQPASAGRSWWRSAGRATCSRRSSWRSADDVAATLPRPVLLHHLGLADEVVAAVDWWELDRTLEPDHLTSLYVPRLADHAGAAAGVQVARLVASDGHACARSARGTAPRTTRR